MLTPEKISKLNQNKIVEMYTKLNQQLTRDIIKKLKQSPDVSTYTKSQIKTLARQGGKEMFNNALKKAGGISREQKKYIEELFNSVLNSEYNGYKGQFEYNGKIYEVSGSSAQIISSIIRRTNKELKNFTKTIAFETQKTYVDALDELYLKVVSGGYDYASAMKSTINELANKGITISSNGKNHRVESVVRMNLFTSITQTANNISKNIKDEIDADGVWIAPTPYCRPSHRVINGKTMTLEEFKKHEYLLSEPNCYHMANYIVLDAFEAPYSKTELSKFNRNADEVYKKRQKQNYYARQVRNKKEEIANLRGAGETELLNRKKKELRNAQMKYRSYCNKNGLEIDYSATWKAGYNK